MRPLILREHGLVLDSALRCHVETMDQDLYARLDSNYANFAGCSLITEYSFEQDWPTWEMHPAGDEILYLLQGAATVLLQNQAGQRSTISFDVPGSCLVVPRGVWHTMQVAQACRILFITPGEGTQNQADAPPR